MKFRMVFLGPEDEPHQQEHLDADPGPRRLGLPFAYEKLSLGMVRCERSPNGHYKCIPLANFCAQILTDQIFDDGECQHRPAELSAQCSG